MGVVRFNGQGQATLSAQFGYARDRLDGVSTTKTRRYAETIWGTGQFQGEYKVFPGVPSGTHEYLCYSAGRFFGTWFYYYDGEPIHQITKPELKGVTGNRYAYSTEIHNKEDDMFGTSTAKCNFTGCEFSVNWGTFQNAIITDEDLFSDDLSEWETRRVNSTAFNVWDVNVNP